VNGLKEDWYLKLHGLTVGPRVELINEMREEAGVAFHAQTMARFVESASSLMQFTVKGTTVSEVSRLDEVDRASMQAATAAELPQQELQQGGLPRPREHADEGRVEVIRDRRSASVLRLEVRQRDLVSRVAQLKAELNAARRSAEEEGGGRPDDPRSYVRAIEARLETSSHILADVTDELQRLRLAADEGPR